MEPPEMALSTIVTIYLALFCSYNFVGSETLGGVVETLKTNNIDVALTASQIQQQNLTKTVEDVKNFTKTVQKQENLNVVFSPRFLSRIDAPSTRSTITYKLGKRVSGEIENTL